MLRLYSRAVSLAMVTVAFGGIGSSVMAKGWIVAPHGESRAASHDLRRPQPREDYAAHRKGGQEVTVDELVHRSVEHGINAIKTDVMNKLQDGDDPTAQFWNRFYFDVHFSQRSTPMWSISTIQPLYEDDDNTVFTELRLSTKKVLQKTRNTGNLGLGYRRFFMDGKVMAGVNAFYDQELPTNHQRVGAGLELLTSFLDLRANAYFGVSAEREINATTKEKALSGFDFEMGVPLPYLPTTRFFVRHYQWNTTKGTDAGSEGQRYSLRFEAADYIMLEGGVIKPKKEKSRAFGRINVRIPFYGDDSFRWADLISERPYEFKSVKEQRLWRVRRHHEIVVERTTTTGAGANKLTVRMVKGA